MNSNKMSKRKIILNLIIIILLLGGLISISLKFSDYDVIKKSFENINGINLLYAILCSIGFCFFSGYAGYLLIKNRRTKMRNRLALYINNTEMFFNGITPFQMGSQPFIVYYYLKNEVDGEDTTSTILFNTILFQFVSIVISTISIFIFYQSIYQKIGAKVAIIWVGWAINLMLFLGLLSVVYIPGFYKFVISLFKLLAKIKPLKKPMEKLIKKTPQTVINTQKTIKGILKNPWETITLVIVKAISVVFYCSIAFFAARALKHEVLAVDYGYLFVISISSSVLMGWIPLPGASGGTEGAFVLLLSFFSFKSGLQLTESEAVSVMLLWRFVAYYFSIIYGLFFLILTKIFTYRQARREKKFMHHAYNRFKENKPINMVIFTDSFSKRVLTKINTLIEKDTKIDLYANKKTIENVKVLPEANKYNIGTFFFFKKIIAYFKAIKISKKETYDVILADNSKYLGHVGKYLARITGAPLVYFVRDNEISLPLSKHITNLREIELINASRFVFFYNKEHKSHILKRYKIKAKNFLLISDILDMPVEDVHKIGYEKLGFNTLRTKFARGSAMNVLLLGGLSYQGLEVANTLNKYDNNISIIDELKNNPDKLGLPSLSEVRYYRGSRFNNKLIKRVIKKNNIDVVIDLYDTNNYLLLETNSNKIEYRNDLEKYKEILKMLELLNIKYIYSQTAYTNYLSNNYLNYKIKEEKELISSNLNYLIINTYNIAGSDISIDNKQNEGFIYDIHKQLKNKNYNINLKESEDIQILEIKDLSYAYLLLTNHLVENKITRKKIDLYNSNIIKTDNLLDIFSKCYETKINLTNNNSYNLLPINKTTNKTLDEINFKIKNSYNKIIEDTTN